VIPQQSALDIVFTKLRLSTLPNITGTAGPRPQNGVTIWVNGRMPTPVPDRA